MVGSTIAADLAADAGIRVTVADAREEALDRVRKRLGVDAVQGDLSDTKRVKQLAEGYDIVLGALASTLGHQTLKTVIEAGKPYVDISFMPDRALDFAKLAEERGVCAVVDCGVAPGMTNMFAGYAARELDPCKRITMYVGGVPAERFWPFEYKAGFAPYDVIEEYTRPARVVENGELVVKEALSGRELLDFPGFGTLEAFNTDGLRSLVETLKVPEMVEKTMRYPGHAELMRVFRETGLFSEEPIEVDGVRVRPRALIAKLMFPKWQFQPGEADVVVLRVVAEGEKNGRPTFLRWDMIDRHDPETDTRSMSRTTAFPATIVARMILDGRFRRPGVHPPEILGQEPGVLDTVLAELAKRGVRYTAEVGPIPAPGA